MSVATASTAIGVFIAADRCESRVGPGDDCIMPGALRSS
jgi:hypothetical protein